MHDNTKTQMYSKTRRTQWHGRWRAFALTVILVGAGVLALATPSQSINMSVNNVHCAQFAGGDPLTKGSGYPFHDHHNQDLRGNCEGITQPPFSGVLRYAVGATGEQPITWGELYLRAQFQFEVTGRVCLTHDGDGWQEWSCGQKRDWGSNTWEHFHHDEGRYLPHAAFPTGTNVAVGFAENEPCTGTQHWECNGVTAHVLRYSGNSFIAAKILDSSGGTPDANVYMETNDFKFWRVHDPTEDDTLEIGGLPLQLSPGTRLTLVDQAIEVEYVPSVAGGNEWRVSSTDDSDTVFVWSNADDEWHVYHLDYE